MHTHTCWLFVRCNDPRKHRMDTPGSGECLALQPPHLPLQRQEEEEEDEHATKTREGGSGHVAAERGERAHTCDVLRQDVCEIRTEASPQQHVAALGGHASSHDWGVSAHRPSVPRYVAGGLDQLVEQGFVEHKTSAGQRNVRKNC